MIGFEAKHRPARHAILHIRKYRPRLTRSFGRCSKLPPDMLPWTYFNGECTLWGPLMCARL